MSNLIEQLQKELIETRKWRQQTAEFCDRARDERDHYRDKYHEQQAEIERLTARNKNQCERLDQQIKHNADLLNRLAALERDDE